jgi:hypothetical protein
MYKSTNPIYCMVMFCVSAILVACGSSNQPSLQATDDPGAPSIGSTPTQQPPVSPPQTNTPTPTTNIIPEAPTATPAPEKPTGGELEVRFGDPETQEECIGHLPFTISWGDPFSIDGGGAYQCAFEKQQCGDGVCVTYHSSYELDFTLAGMYFDPSQDFPSGLLHMAPALTAIMKQWWSDIPPETTMPFTEDNPFRVENSDILTLNFNLQDGAQEEIPNPNAPDAAPMIFILHLSQ